MKRRIFSLVVCLIIILAAPALIQSCVHKADVSTSSTTAINAEVSTLVYHAPGVAQCRDVAYSSVQDAVEPAAEDDGSLGIWASVISAILLIISVFFGAKYKQALNVISKIQEALADGKVSAAEIKGIINAFKGTT